MPLWITRRRRRASIPRIFFACSSLQSARRSRGGWLPVQSDFEKKTGAMTDPAAQRLLRELQEEAESAFDYDAAISGILADELPYFFAGEQTAEQIADRIQRRVCLYLEETYK